MIKVFTLNKNNKIELTKEELESLLNESYWEGYNKKNYWTYTSPTTPYQWLSNTPYTINSSSDSITIKTNLGE